MFGGGRRGRPRKEGERHPGGRLVQKVAPNGKVVALREALMGEGARDDLAAAEDPMRLALARGWLTEAQHRAGVIYGAAWRRSHPQHRVRGLEETPEPGARDTRRVSELSDEEIVQAFDAVFQDGGRLSEDSEVEARSRYNAFSQAMTTGEQNEVFLCFCLGSWPQWLLQRCAGRFDTSWERKRRLLISGLETLGALSRPKRRTVGQTTID